MSRVIAIGPGGVPQAPERDDRFGHVIDLVVSHGLLDRKFISPPLRDFEQADDNRRAILRSARYYCSCGQVTCTRRHKNYPRRTPEGGMILAGCPNGGQRVTGRADVVRDKQGQLRVQFIFHDKQESMRFIIRKYGTDRSKWPYDPWAKQLKKEQA